MPENCALSCRMVSRLSGGSALICSGVRDSTCCSSSYSVQMSVSHCRLGCPRHTDCTHSLLVSEIRSESLCWHTRLALRWHAHAHAHLHLLRLRWHGRALAVHRPSALLVLRRRRRSIPRRRSAARWARPPVAPHTGRPAAAHHHALRRHVLRARPSKSALLRWPRHRGPAHRGWAERDCASSAFCRRRHHALQYSRVDDVHHQHRLEQRVRELRMPVEQRLRLVRRGRHEGLEIETRV